MVSSSSRRVVVLVREMVEVGREARGGATRGLLESISRRGTTEKRRSSSGRRRGTESGRRTGTESGRRMATARRKGMGTEKVRRKGRRRERSQRNKTTSKLRQ